MMVAGGWNADGAADPDAGHQTIHDAHLQSDRTAVRGLAAGVGVLVYRGRKTGHVYRMPINAFRRGDSYVFALTYGADVQWVKNVVAAGGCTLRTRGRDIRLVDPELFVDPGRRFMPLLVRFVLRLDRATEFLRMRIARPA
jgi:deazaflavin-dependent oxidoreductase (nitroreductase family)